MNEEAKNEKSGSGFAIGFLFGAIAGAVLIFLFGTEKGKKFKKELQKKGKFSFKNLSELLEEFEEKGSEFKKKTEEITKNLEKKVESKSPEIKKVPEKGLDHIQKLQERGRTIAGRFFKRNGKRLK